MAELFIFVAIILVSVCVRDIIHKYEQRSLNRQLSDYEDKLRELHSKQDVMIIGEDNDHER
jgi:archaellum component FlaG (FlaF/FlaG flagellin family)